MFLLSSDMDVFILCIHTEMYLFIRGHVKQIKYVHMHRCFGCSRYICIYICTYDIHISIYVYILYTYMHIFFQDIHRLNAALSKLMDPQDLAALLDKAAEVGGGIFSAFEVVPLSVVHVLPFSSGHDSTKFMS